MNLETTHAPQSLAPALHDLPKLNLLDLQIHFFNDLRAKGRSGNTLKNYKTDLECFNQYLKKTTMHLNIDGFTISHIEEYDKFLQKKYSSDNSKRRRVQALRIFFDFLVSQGHFGSNPVRKLPTSPKFLDIPRPTPFIDVKTLWEHLLEESQTGNKMNRLLSLRNQVVMLFIFGGGLKVSDITRLKMEDIFLGEGPRVLVKPEKRDPYSVPLPAVFSTAFEVYKNVLEQEKKIAGLDFENVLFNANPYQILSGGLSPRGLEIVFEELRKKLLLTLTPKSLRQACIFKWLQKKLDESLIKEWMGVAPSYSLKLYRDHLSSHSFDDSFLQEIYDHFKSRPRN